jgi:recombination protein RecA
MTTKPKKETNKDEKKPKKNLNSLVAKINKSFGGTTGEAIMQMTPDAIKKVEVISTGSMQLDAKLGIGGFPKGRIIEIYGPEASGKTTLSLHAIAECQKAGGTVAFVDAEHALDPTYAENIGICLDDMLLAQPESGEQALDITQALVESGDVDLVVVDSVAALTPKAELDGEMGDQQMGLQARMMGKALRKLTSIISQKNCSVIFINQVRMKIGVMYGNPETTSGGKALPFAASMRLKIGRKNTDGTSGIMRVKVVKNKLAVPFVDVEVPIVFGKGIDQRGEAIAMALNEKIALIEVVGRSYYYTGTKAKLANGEFIENDPEKVNNKIATKKDDALKFLDDNPEFTEELQKQVLVKFREVFSK